MGLLPSLDRRSIAAAAVVVVIWSEGAIGSLYIKAEANKALASGKLVNARAPDVPFSAIPSPYNGMHIDTFDLSEPYRLLRSIRGAGHSAPPVRLETLINAAIFNGGPPQSIARLDEERYRRLRPLLNLGFDL